VTLIVTQDKVKDFLRGIKSLTDERVLVGIPANKAFREPSEDDPHPHINNAEIGFINEFGDPDANIPARPHMVPGVKKALPDIEKVYKKAAQAALAGDTARVKQAHDVVGMKAVSSIQNLITSGIGPPLSDMTLRNRLSRQEPGVGIKKGAGKELKRRAEGLAPSTEFAKPLIDTGQYYRNITYVVDND
jgi:hypothetical protein